MGRHRRSFRRSVVIVAAASVAALVAGVVPADAGSSSDLDPSFGRGGQVVRPFASGASVADIAMVGTRILVAGSTENDPHRIALIRLLPNGNIDQAFGDGGKTFVGFPGGSIQAASLAVLPNRSFVVGGTFDPNGSAPPRFALARFHQDGSLDTSFGHAGRSVANLGAGPWRLNALVRQPGGSMLAAGEGPLRQPGGSRESVFAVAKFRPNGSLDASYGDGGRVLTSFSGPKGFAGSSADALTVDTGGRAVVAGSATLGQCVVKWAIARYLPSGDLDQSFGGDGRVLTAFGDVATATGVAFGDDNRITAAGWTESGGCSPTSPPPTGTAAAARWLPSGKLDRTFGGDGKVTTAFFGSGGSLASYQDMTLEEGGQIAAAGFAQFPSTDGSAVIIGEYLRNGQLNPAFSGDGRASAVGPLQDTSGLALFEDPNGRPVVAGNAWSGQGSIDRFIVERFLASG
jgi:uncharacterized delta-60 repeat protein